MLQSCAWCNSAFPSSELLEHLPVGRRVVFDEAKGRLWVVCRRCERWNLAPIDRRWEAIEECARLFRSAKARFSTDHIGLARMREGTDLVRIGQPQAVEFAAWRYGDQFGRRRVRAVALGVGATAAGGALAMGAVSAGVAFLALLPVLQVGTLLSTLHMTGQLVPRAPIELPSGEGSVVPVGSPALIHASDEQGGWGIDVGYSFMRDAQGRPIGGWLQRALQKNLHMGKIQLYGAAARLQLARHAPSLNRSGASASRIQGAVSVLAEAGDPRELPAFLVKHRRRFAAQQTWGDTGAIEALPSEVRLALEMASHEDVERAMMQGELGALEDQWRSAELEAAISDDLLLPSGVQERLKRMIEGRDGQ